VNEDRKPVVYVCWHCGAVKPGDPYRLVGGAGILPPTRPGPPERWYQQVYYTTHLASGTTIHLAVHFCCDCMSLGAAALASPLPREKQVPALMTALESLGESLAARFIPLNKPATWRDLTAELEAAKAARELLVKASNAAIDVVRRDCEAKLERERSRADAAERRAVEALRTARERPIDPRVDKLCLVQPNDRKDKGHFEAGVYLERRRQVDDTSLFAVTWLSYCLTKTGTWEYEPTPSSRDDAFTARCRFATPEEAEKLALASLHTRWQEVET
jgi:hypothetical protein